MDTRGLAAEYEEALFYLPPTLREVLERVPEGDKGRIREVRLRAGRPLSVYDGSRSRFVTGRGGLADDGKDGLLVDQELLQEAFVRLCDYSEIGRAHV